LATMSTRVDLRSTNSFGEELIEAVPARTERAAPIVHTCCIAGGGPAGMMLGLLLARAGIDVVVLEKHSDFLRDFRGDTVHPSTLQVLDDIRLIKEFLALPHSEVRQLKLPTGRGPLEVDLSKMAGHYPFVAFVPQWDFLELLAGAGRRLPHFHLLMQSEVTDLVVQQGRVAGVRFRGPQGDGEIRALLTVGADGRDSVVRERSGIDVEETSPPLDVFWFRVSRRPDESDAFEGRLSDGHLAVLINRDAYWQVGYVIPKGASDQIKREGIDSFRQTLLQLAPELGERVQEIRSWDDVKLLTVRSNHARRWWRPGLLLIGDAAHAMSPIGGVGINLAIQDAVAAHNILVGALRRDQADDQLLAQVERRRRLPTVLTQRFQTLLQSTVVKPVLTRRTVEMPLPVRVLLRTPYLDRLPARLVGLGFRPERVRTEA
jgi:2-polyprenyl-6-methoxyphenol hydroxylase-like FAD-dependent oxidoreductase